MKCLNKLFCPLRSSKVREIRTNQKRRQQNLSNNTRRDPFIEVMNTKQRLRHDTLGTASNCSTVPSLPVMPPHVNLNSSPVDDDEVSALTLQSARVIYANKDMAKIWLGQGDDDKTHCTSYTRIEIWYTRFSIFTFFTITLDKVILENSVIHFFYKTVRRRIKFKWVSISRALRGSTHQHSTIVVSLSNLSERRNSAWLDQPFILHYTLI